MRLLAPLAQAFRFRRQVPQRSCSSSGRSLVPWLFISGSAIVLAGGLISSYLTLRTVLVNYLKANNLAEVQLTANEIDEWLLMVTAQVETIASAPTVRSMDWAMIQPYFQGELRRIPDLYVLKLVRSDGEYSSTGSDQPPVQVGKGYFQQALHGQVTVDGPISSQFTGIPYATVVIPIWRESSSRLTAANYSQRGNSVNPADKPIGAIVAYVSLRRVSRMIASLPSTEGMEVVALNSRGQVLVTPRQRLSKTPSRVTLQLLPEPIAQLVSDRTAKIDRVKLGGGAVYIAHVPLEQANWTIALITPQSLLEQQLYSLDLLVGGVGTLLAVCSLLLVNTLIRRQRTADALRLSESRLRSYFDLPMVGIAINAPDRSWIEFNDRLCDLLGYTREELMQKTWVDFTHPDDLNLNLDYYQRAMAGEVDQYTLEKRYVRKDGAVIYIHLSTGFIRQPTGEVAYSVSIVQDLTARHQAESALRDSEARLARTEAFSLVMVVWVSLDGRFTKIPPTYCQWLGYSEKELLSMRFQDLTHPDDLELDWLHCQRLIQGEIKSFDMEKRLIRKDGQIIWAELSCSIVTDDAGKPVEFLSYLRDITARKRAEEALRQSEARLRRVIDSNVIGIYFADMDGLVTEANDAFLSIVGYSREDLKSGLLSWKAMTPPGYETLEQQIDAELRTQGVTTIHEKEYFHKDGKSIPVLLGVALVDKDDPQGQEVGFVLDITTHKQVEQQFREALHEKEVMLKEIHHRVKNNLQVVNSLLRLQAHYIQDEVAQAVFKESQGRVLAMSLIHERLYRSHDLAKTDFAQYIHDLANDLFRTYGVDPARVSLRIHISNVMLSIDTAIPCGLIVNELVSNALKYAFPDDRRGRINISLRRGNQNNYVLRVSDDGVGIPPEIDFRDTQSLGLHLVCTLTRQLGGTIELDRLFGTEFRITFAENS